MDVLELKGVNSKMLKSSTSFQEVNPNAFKTQKRRPPKESFCEFDIIDNFRQERMSNVRRKNNDAKETNELLKKIKELTDRNIQIKEMYKNCKQASDSHKEENMTVLECQSSNSHTTKYAYTSEEIKKRNHHKSRSLIRTQSIEKKYAATEDKVTDQITRIIAMEGNLEKELRKRKSRSAIVDVKNRHKTKNKSKDSKNSKLSKESSKNSHDKTEASYFCKLETKITKEDSICKNCSGTMNKRLEKETIEICRDVTETTSKTKKRKSKDKKPNEIKEIKPEKYSKRKSSRDKNSKNSESSGQKLITVYDNSRAIEYSDSASKDSKCLFMDEAKHKEKKLEENKRKMMNFFGRKKKEGSLNDKTEKKERHKGESSRKHSRDKDSDQSKINPICTQLVTQTLEQKCELMPIKIEKKERSAHKVKRDKKEKSANKIKKSEKKSSPRSSTDKRNRIMLHLEGESSNLNQKKKEKTPRDDKSEKLEAGITKKLEKHAKPLAIKYDNENATKSKRVHSREVIFTNDPKVYYFETCNDAKKLNNNEIINKSKATISNIKEAIHNKTQSPPGSPKRPHTRHSSVSKDAAAHTSNNILQDIMQVYKVEKSNLSGKLSPKEKRKNVKTSSDEETKRVKRKEKSKSNNSTPKLDRKELSFSNLNLLPVVNFYSQVDSPLIAATTQTSTSIEEIKDIFKEKPRHHWYNKFGKAHTETVSFNYQSEMTNPQLSKTTIALRDINKVAEMEKNNTSARKREKWFRKRSKEQDNNNSFQSEIISRKELLDRLSIKETVPHYSKKPGFVEKFTSHSSKTYIPNERMIEISSKMLQNQQISFTVEGTEPPKRIKSGSTTSRMFDKNSLKVTTFPGVHVDANNPAIRNLNHGTYKRLVQKPKVIELETLLGNKNLLENTHSESSLLLGKVHKKKNTVMVNRSVETIPRKHKHRHMYANKSVDMLPREGTASSGDMQFDKSIQAIMKHNNRTLFKDKSVDAVIKIEKSHKDLPKKRTDEMDVAKYEEELAKQNKVDELVVEKPVKKKVHDLSIKKKNLNEIYKINSTDDLYNKIKKIKRIYADKANESNPHAEVQVCTLHLPNKSHTKDAKLNLLKVCSSTRSKNTYKIYESRNSSPRKFRNKRTTTSRKFEKSLGNDLFTNPVVADCKKIEKLTDIQKEICRAKKTIAKNLTTIGNTLNPLQLSDINNAKVIIANNLAAMHKPERHLVTSTYTDGLEKFFKDAGTNLSIFSTTKKDGIVDNRQRHGKQALNIREYGTQTIRRHSPELSASTVVLTEHKDRQNLTKYTTSSEIRNEMHIHRLEMVNQLVYTNILEVSSMRSCNQSTETCPCYHQSTETCPCSAQTMNEENLSDNHSRFPYSVSQLINNQGGVRDNKVLMYILNLLNCDKNDSITQTEFIIEAAIQKSQTKFLDERVVDVVDYNDENNPSSSDLSEPGDKDDKDAVKNIYKKIQIAFKAVFENENIFKSDKEFEDILKLCDKQHTLPRNKTNSDDAVVKRKVQDVILQRNIKGEEVETQTPDVNRKLTIKNVPVVSKIPVSTSDSSYLSAFPKQSDNSYGGAKPNVQKYRPNTPKKLVPDKIRLSSQPKQHRKEIVALEKCLNNILSKLNDTNDSTSNAADSCTADKSKVYTYENHAATRNKLVETNSPPPKFRTSLSKYHKAKVYGEKVRERVKKRTDLESQTSQTNNYHKTKSRLSINRSSKINSRPDTPKYEETDDFEKTSFCISVPHEKRVKSVFRNNKGFISSATSLSSRPSEYLELSSSYPKSSPSLQLGITDFVINYTQPSKSYSSTVEIMKRLDVEKSIERKSRKDYARKSIRKKSQNNADLKRMIKKTPSKLPLYEKLKEYDSIPNIVILSVSSTCTLYTSPSSFMNRIERRLVVDNTVVENSIIPTSSVFNVTSSKTTTEIKSYESESATDDELEIPADKGIISKTPFFIEDGTAVPKVKNKDMVSSDSLEMNCKELCPLTAVFNITPQSYAYLVYNTTVIQNEAPRPVPIDLSRPEEAESDNNTSNITSFAAPSGKNTSIVFNDVLKPRLQLSLISPNKLLPYVSSPIKRRCVKPNDVSRGSASNISGDFLETTQCSDIIDLSDISGSKDDYHSLQIPRNIDDNLRRSSAFYEKLGNVDLKENLCTFADMAETCGKCNNIIVNYRTKCDCILNDNYDSKKMCTFSDFSSSKHIGNNHIITSYINRSPSIDSVCCCEVASSSSLRENESGYSTSKTNKTNSLLSFFKKGGSLLDMFRPTTKINKKLPQEVPSVVSLTVIAETESSLVPSTDSSTTNATLNIPKPAYWFNVGKLPDPHCNKNCPNDIAQNAGGISEICKNTCHKIYKENEYTRKDKCCGGKCTKIDESTCTKIVRRKRARDCGTGGSQKINQHLANRGTGESLLIHKRNGQDRATITQEAGPKTDQNFCHCACYIKKATACQEYCEKVILESTLRKEGYLKQFKDFKEIPLEVLMGRRMCSKRTPPTTCTRTACTGPDDSKHVESTKSKSKLAAIASKITKSKCKLSEWRNKSKSKITQNKSVISLEELLPPQKPKKSTTKIKTVKSTKSVKSIKTVKSVISIKTVKSTIITQGINLDDICDCSTKRPDGLCTECTDETLTPICNKDVNCCEYCNKPKRTLVNAATSTIYCPNKIPGEICDTSNRPVDPVKVETCNKETCADFPRKLAQEEELCTCPIKDSRGLCKECGDDIPIISKIPCQHQSCLGIHDQLGELGIDVKNLIGTSREICNCLTKNEKQVCTECIPVIESARCNNETCMNKSKISKNDLSPKVSGPAPCKNEVCPTIAKASKAEVTKAVESEICDCLDKGDAVLCTECVSEADCICLNKEDDELCKVCAEPVEEICICEDQGNGTLCADCEDAPEPATKITTKDQSTDPCTDEICPIKYTMDTGVNSKIITNETGTNPVLETTITVNRDVFAEKFKREDEGICSCKQPELCKMCLGPSKFTEGLICICNDDRQSRMGIKGLDKSEQEIICSCPGTGIGDLCLICADDEKGDECICLTNNNKVICNDNLAVQIPETPVDIPTCKICHCSSKCPSKLRKNKVPDYSICICAKCKPLTGNVRPEEKQKICRCSSKSSEARILYQESMGLICTCADKDEYGVCTLCDHPIEAKSIRTGKVPVEAECFCKYPSEFHAICICPDKTAGGLCSICPIVCDYKLKNEECVCDKSSFVQSPESLCPCDTKKLNELCISCEDPEEEINIQTQSKCPSKDLNCKIENEYVKAITDLKSVNVDQESDEEQIQLIVNPDASRTNCVVRCGLCHCTSNCISDCEISTKDIDNQMGKPTKKKYIYTTCPCDSKDTCTQCQIEQETVKPCEICQLCKCVKSDENKKCSKCATENENRVIGKSLQNKDSALEMFKRKNSDSPDRCRCSVNEFGLCHQCSGTSLSVLMQSCLADIVSFNKVSSDLNVVNYDGLKTKGFPVTPPVRNCPELCPKELTKHEFPAAEESTSEVVSDRKVNHPGVIDTCPIADKHDISVIQETKVETTTKLIVENYESVTEITEITTTNKAKPQLYDTEPKSQIPVVISKKSVIQEKSAPEKLRKDCVQNCPKARKRTDAIMKRNDSGSKSREDLKKKGALSTRILAVPSENNMHKKYAKSKANLTPYTVSDSDESDDDEEDFSGLALQNKESALKMIPHQKPDSVIEGCTCELNEFNLCSKCSGGSISLHIKSCLEDKKSFAKVASDEGLDFDINLRTSHFSVVPPVRDCPKRCIAKPANPKSIRRAQLKSNVSVKNRIRIDKSSSDHVHKLYAKSVVNMKFIPPDSDSSDDLPPAIRLSRRESDTKKDLTPKLMAAPSAANVEHKVYRKSYGNLRPYTDFDDLEDDDNEENDNNDDYNSSDSNYGPESDDKAELVSAFRKKSTDSKMNAWIADQPSDIDRPHKLYCKSKANLKPFDISEEIGVENNNEIEVEIKPTTMDKEIKDPACVCKAAQNKLLQGTVNVMTVATDLIKTKHRGNKDKVKLVETTSNMKRSLLKEKSDFNRITSNELMELMQTKPSDILKINEPLRDKRRNLTDKEVFDRLLTKFERQEKIAKQFGKDDQFFYDQIKTIGIAYTDEQFHSSQDVVTTENAISLNPNGCMPAEPEDIGTTFARGFRADNIILKGDACFAINKQDKVHLTPHLSPTTESIIDFSERETPLDFMLGIGYTVDEASNALKDDDIRGRLLAAITEARVWINKITSSQGTLLYLVAYKASPETMRYYLQLVEAIINKRIDNAVKLDGFLRILERLETGEIKMSTILGESEETFEVVEEDVDVVKLKLIELFGKVYLTAKGSLSEETERLSKVQIHLLKELTTKYTSALNIHMNFLASYIGRGKIFSGKQLQDAITYLSGILGSEVNRKDFETYCALQSEEQKIPMLKK